MTLRHAADAADDMQEYKLCPCEYTVELTVVTRSGEIPIRGALVKLDDQRVGVTDEKGTLRTSEPRTSPTLQIEVVYENTTRHLKRETFRLRIDGIDTKTGAFTPGQSRNTILKIRDVLGTGSPALPGDVDFEDSYATEAPLVTFNAGEKRFCVRVKMATLSLSVPYRSQNSGSETLKNQSTFKGSILCMPASTEMLLGYWELTDDAQPFTRLDVMQGTYDVSPNKNTRFPAPWQRWPELRAWTQTQLTAAAKASEASSQSNASEPSAVVPKLKAGASIPNVTNVANVPSQSANSMRDRLVAGEPFIVSIVGGHIVLVRGAVVDHQNQVQWLVINDPNGTLSSPDSVYGTLHLEHSVGAEGQNDPGDVSAIQDILRSFGRYNGQVNGIADEATLEAIRRFQGGAKPSGLIAPGDATERKFNTQLKSRDKPWYSGPENERSGLAAPFRGDHVYYNGTTESRGATGTLRLNVATNLMILNRTPTFTAEEVSRKLTPGFPPEESDLRQSQRAQE